MNTPVSDKVSEVRNQFFAQYWSIFLDNLDLPNHAVEIFHIVHVQLLLHLEIGWNPWDILMVRSGHNVGRAFSSKVKLERSNNWKVFPTSRCYQLHFPTQQRRHHYCWKGRVGKLLPTKNSRSYQKDYSKESPRDSTGLLFLREPTISPESI